MKYPITPDYMDAAPEKIVMLFRDLDEFIISDICKRFAYNGEATNTAIEQIKLLRRRGYSQSAIEARIKKTLKLTDKQLDAIFADAIKRNSAYFSALATKADLINASFESEAMRQEISGIINQTKEEFYNLTQTTAFAIRDFSGKVEMLSPEAAFYKVLDQATLQVESGALSYNEAITQAVKKLSDSGAQFVNYESGWHNRVDVAARRAVMTGISQISAKYTEAAMDDLDAAYVEVSAHIGARDTGAGPENHKEWQGKVYHVEGKPRVEGFNDSGEFHEKTGYGTGEGLCGWNCRHSFFPFVPGVSERTYTDSELQSIDPPDCEFEGRKYTAYQATQKQRQIETALRKHRRAAAGFEAAGDTDNATIEKAKIRRLRAEYEAFSETANIPTQFERTKI